MADNGAEKPASVEAAELAEIVRGIRDRVRARYPETSGGGEWRVALPDLNPLARARDAAAGKVASIGKVNPRPGGPFNSLIQWIKGLVSRSLNWHVREQVEFNRHVLTALEATLEALNEANRTIAAMAARIDVSGGSVEDVRHDLRQLTDDWHGRVEEIGDMRKHWEQWRAGWEQKLFINETQFLRSVADLQGAFQHRVTQIESNFRDIVKSQHADFSRALTQSGEENQKRFWGEVEKVLGEMETVRRSYERMIHEELRVVRQRAALRDTMPAGNTVSEPAAFLDYGRFAERFRGSEEYVRTNLQFYRPYFQGRRRVADLGCGRGEFLELMREMGVTAEGVDLSEESVALCRHKGLEAACADLFPYLANLGEGSLDGIYSGQVVEHLPPEKLPEMIRLAARVLEPGGILAIETPNPACLAIFATHFYLDPTHVRPVPSPLLAFYMEEAGLGRIESHPLSPAVESMPALSDLPEGFREAFFGGLDYAILGVRL